MVTREGEVQQRKSRCQKSQSRLGLLDGQHAQGLQSGCLPQVLFCKSCPASLGHPSEAQVRCVLENSSSMCSSMRTISAGRHGRDEMR